MPAMKFPDYGAARIERGKQGRCSMAHVIMGAALSNSRRQRQHRLRAVQGLDLALLIHTKHHRLGRRLEIQAHDIADLLNEQRIGGELERFASMRLKPKRSPHGLTVLCETWSFLASSRVLQCVASTGRSFSVAAINCSIFASPCLRARARPRLIEQTVHYSAVLRSANLVHDFPSRSRLMNGTSILALRCGAGHDSLRVGEILSFVSDDGCRRRLDNRNALMAIFKRQMDQRRKFLRPPGRESERFGHWSGLKAGAFRAQWLGPAAARPAQAVLWQ